MGTEFKDYYRVLGVTPQATADEIKTAFRSLARKYHPDVAKDKKAAEEKFKEINEANEVLSNPEQRLKFDELKAGWSAGTPRFNNSTGPARETAGFSFEGTGFSDFFEQFFGERSHHSRRPSGFDAEQFNDYSPERSRGQDIQGDLLITLDEVLKGGIRTLSVRRNKFNQAEAESCQVRIPRGVKEGQAIRVTGKGGAGLNGGEAGDIYLRAHYAQHPDWSVIGADLIGHLDLAPWEAVLGATIQVLTLDGIVTIKVPAGLQQGQKLRVKARGLPIGLSGRGDLYVEALIQVPKCVNKQMQQLWAELGSKSNFNPRKL